MKFRPLIAAALLAGVVATVRAQDAAPATLKVGDDAPTLAVGKWVKGEPVKIEAGKIYVVEFWATWCGPCRATIPHLTELAKKHTDVTFVGQDVFEQDETLVEPFIKEMGEKMDYHVATDDKSKMPEGAMATNWMKAAAQNGIPTAFVVTKDSKIAWIGHPADPAMETVIEKVVAGTFDPKAEAAAAKAKAVTAEKVSTLNRDLTAAANAGKTDDALKATGELIKLLPDSVEKLTAAEYKLLSKAGRYAEAHTRGETLVKTAKDPMALNDVAWGVALRADASADDIKMAHDAIDKANTLTEQKEPDLLDTSARVYAVEKNWTKAIEIQTKAIAAAADADAKAELQKNLDAYKSQTLPPVQ